MLELGWRTFDVKLIEDVQLRCAGVDGLAWSGRGRGSHFHGGSSASKSGVPGGQARLRAPILFRDKPPSLLLN